MEGSKNKKILKVSNFFFIQKNKKMKNRLFDDEKEGKGDFSKLSTSAPQIYQQC